MVKSDTDWLGQSNTGETFWTALTEGGNSRETLWMLSQQNTTTPHKTYIYNASLLYCWDTRNLGPKNSELQDHVWLCSPITRPDDGLLLLSSFYTFLFAGSVDRDHDRDSLSALCSYKKS